MNGRQRVFAAARGLETDCCPVTPYDGNFCIAQSGFEISSCYTNGKRLAEAQIIGRDKTGQDVVNAQSEQYYICEALGVKTDFSENMLPKVLDVPVKELADVEKLRVSDPYHDGRMYVYIEAVGHLAEHYKKEVAIRAPGTGPFALAGHMMGVNNFIMSIAEAEADEDLESQQRLLQMIQICCDSLIAYAKACVLAGADIVQNADSLASLNMVSPRIYEKYCFPFEKQFFDALRPMQKEHDFLMLLHICGDNSKIAERLADTGCDLLEVDSAVDLRDYKRRIGERVCIMGNMSPTGVIFRGTPEEVHAEATVAMDRAYHNGRFCLGSGCEVAVHAPLENVIAMVQAGHNRR